MIARVTLTLRAPLTEPLVVDGLTPERLTAEPAARIAAWPVSTAGGALRLGDVFDVRDGTGDAVVLRGDLRLVEGIGAGMTGGRLVVEGSAGPRTGAGLAGGHLLVDGSVGDEAAAGMRGGVLRVRGSAGDRLAAPWPGAPSGMTGGEVVVDGSAGCDAAARVRRGLVAVGGAVGPQAARAMIAGTLVVGGAVRLPGRGSARGSVVALGPIEVPETYREACTYAPVYLRLLLTHLGRVHGFRFDPGALEDRYRRYCGDAGGVGRGEILARLLP